MRLGNWKKRKKTRQNVAKRDLLLGVSWEKEDSSTSGKVPQKGESKPLPVLSDKWGKEKMV